MFSKLTNEIDRNKTDEENIDTIKGFIGVFGLKVKQAETKKDSRFFLYGRMKFLLEELDKNLNENKYIDALFDMSDFLDESRIQPNYEGYDPLIVDKNKEYYSEDIICTEEKDLLMAIVKQFIQKIENRNNDKKMFSQDELKELFYRTMNENEVSKLKELGMDDEIAKLTTSTHQVKYFDGIGYVLIGDGYIVQANGMEQQRYFATIVNSPEEAKQEIIKKLPKQSPTDNNISLEKACEIALNYYKQFGYSSISEIKDTGDKLLIIPQNWERKVGEHLIMIDKVSGKKEQCIMPLVLFEDLVSNSSNVDVPTKYSDGNPTNITAKKDIEDVVNEVVTAIEKLPKETEISIFEILKSDIEKYDTKELFEINKKVIKKCEEIGIKLNFDKYKGQIVGLPFNIPFIKE